jgi:CBS domain-containing protein
MKDWIPLINKLVWPVIIGVLLLLFHKELNEVYTVALERLKSGGSIEIGGFLKLGEKATETEIKDLSLNNISIEGIGGAEGVVRKGSQSSLDRIQEELANAPEKIINTLLITDDIEIYSVTLLKEYVSTLGLHYVVFQERGKFVGWMTADLFVAQLPSEIEDREVRYAALRTMKGIRKYYVEPGTSAKEVLVKMQELHIDSIPVVDENKRWLFFANRGEILANLMTSILLSKEE